MSKLVNFSNFITESLKKIPPSIYGLIKERWDGGYEVVVGDHPSQNDRGKDLLYIAKTTPKAIALTYLKIDGSESNYFWIPSYACKIFKKSSYSKIDIPSYTKWFNDQKKNLLIENFLNDYIEEVEKGKKGESDLNMKSASEDVDLILDRLGMYDSVASINIDPSRSSKFKGYTENGISFEISKDSQESLIGSLDFYKDKESSRPFLSYRLSGRGQSPSFTFYIDGKQHVIRKNFSELTNDKYFSYLSKRSLDAQSKEDEKDFMEYMENFLSGMDWDYQYSEDRKAYERGQESSDHLNKLRSLALEFMSDGEVSSLISSYRKK